MSDLSFSHNGTADETTLMGGDLPVCLYRHKILSISLQIDSGIGGPERRGNLLLARRERDAPVVFETFSEPHLAYHHDRPSEKRRLCCEVRSKGARCYVLRFTHGFLHITQRP
jgi:hypothetical protein